MSPSFVLHANTLGRVDDRRVVNDEGDRIDDRFLFREVELDVSSRLGDWAEGVVVLATEAETPGEFETGVEEAFVLFSGIPLVEEFVSGVELRAGRFRSHFGRLNRLHLHAFPTPTRSIAFENFLGEEGLVSDGFQLYSDLHSGDSGEVRAGIEVFNGGGIPLALENEAQDLAFVGRLTGHAKLFEGHSLELGASAYRGAFDPRGKRRAILLGADAAYLWEGEEGRALRLASEAYYGSVSGHREMAQDPDAEGPGSPSSPVGCTIRAESCFNESIGLTGRFDWTEALDDEREESRRYGLFLTFRPLEDVRCRVGLERTLSTIRELDGLDTGLLEIQFRFGRPRHDHGP